MIKLLKNSHLSYYLLIILLSIGTINNSHAELPPYLSILVPSSNTTWVKGNNVPIIWTDNISNNVELKLYQGNNFVRNIISSTPSDGSHNFTVPTNLSNGSNYRVRIAAIGNPSLFHFSPYFSITGNTPSINITNPSNNTVWNKGQSVTIQWTDNISGNVGIELYKGGTSPVYTVVASTASDGSHSFVVPTHLVNGTNYQVHMYDINNTSTQTSSPLFTITGSNPIINITNPTNSTVWIKGQTVPIQWTDNISSNVRIQLLRGNLFVATIASNTPSDGTHNYPVPGVLPDASNYRIRIQDISNPSTVKYSAYFSISSPNSGGNITISNPTSGTIWRQGQTKNIQWTDNIPSNVKIELYKGGLLERTIAANTASDGSFNYIVPNNLANGSNYQVKITSLGISPATSLSSFFTITNISNGAIVINAPLTNSIWTVGQTQTIQWSDNIPENVKIELFKGSTRERTVTASTQSDGAHNYAVPTNLNSGSNYRIKISSINNASIFDFSDFFTINNPSNNGSITITNPTTNTTWIKGQTKLIQWSDNIPGNVRIQLYRENTAVTTIQGSTASDGSHTYTVPTFLVNSNRYRVRITDVNNAAVSDYSEYFTITTFISNPNNLGSSRNHSTPETTNETTLNQLAQKTELSAMLSPNPQAVGHPSQCIVQANQTTKAIMIVSDITGKVVQQRSLHLQKGENKLIIEPLASKGIYIVSIQSPTSQKSLKLVVTNGH